ncbi:hypothetical protein [Nocardia jinanensis]|uniref:hypothetical protein n=1 Tax=Nocardia jinanensis TaxID=382504 RepID=UPI001662C55E|nr:hypothetical protein [Nocardia jinanensis]
MSDSPADPLGEALPDGDELADRALEQEDTGKQLLERIESSDVGTADFEQALTEFIAAMREHIDYGTTGS